MTPAERAELRTLCERATPGPAIAYALSGLVVVGAVALAWAAHYDAAHRTTVSGPHARSGYPAHAFRLHAPAGESVRLRFRDPSRIHRWECCRPGGWILGECHAPPEGSQYVRWGDGAVVATELDMFAPAGVVDWWVPQRTHVAVLSEAEADCAVVEMAEVIAERGRK